MPDSQGSSGPYKGIDYANVPSIVGMLCTDSKGNIDVTMYKAITKEFYLEDLLDLWEMKQVSDSWSKAAQANLDLKQKQKKQR